MKIDLFQSVATAEFSKFAGVLSATLTASSLRISSPGISSPPLALFVVMLPKAHLTWHSRMSGSMWVVTPLCLSGSWQSFLYSSFGYSCYLFLISSASVRSRSFLSFIVPIFAWNVPLDLQVLLELTPPKRCPFHYKGLECKSRKSRDTWSNRQTLPWSTEWTRERLIRLCQLNVLDMANTLFQQHKKRLYSWASPDGRSWNQHDYILCSHRWGNSIQSVKQDQELTVAQIMNSLLPNSDFNWRK